MNTRMKAVRQRESKTQKEFGESLGVSRDTLASYESGRVIPSKTFVQLLCATYCVNEEWLTTGEGNPYVESEESAISALASEFNLDKMAKNILRVYNNLDDGQRDGVRKFIKSLAQSVLEESLVLAHSEIQNEEERSALHAKLDEELAKEKKAESQASFVKESDAG